MFFQLISRVVCTSAGFVYPTYASYKAIKSNDMQKLEVWLMYWVVMGTVMAMESTVEWIFAWFPFYYECKTIVILWLTLPQIQGSTYLYVAHIHPFLLAHEDDIDAAVADAKVRAKQVGLDYLNAAIQRIRQAVVGTLAPQFLDETPRDPSAPSHVMHLPPSLADPASGATSQLYSLAGNVLRQYGPAAVAAGSALLHPMNGRAPSVRREGPATLHRQSNEQMRNLGVQSSYASGSSSAGPPYQPRERTISSQSRDSSSSASSSPQYSNNPPPGYRPNTYHPRSVSAGPYPVMGGNNGGGRGSVGSRIERSFVGGYGFEEIRKDELGDYPPVKAVAMEPPMTPGGTRRSWWFWGQQEVAARGVDDGRAKKDE